MKRLIFDCSSDVASIAVFREEELVAELTVSGRKNHAAILLPSIDQCLKDADMILSELDEVYVCSGPGSFTGVKVGLATALGLTAPGRMKLYVFPYAALILSKALMIYPRLLDGVSEDFKDYARDGVITLAMDAGRGELYTTLLEVSQEGAGVKLAGAKLVKADEKDDKFLIFSDLPARLLFEMPEKYRKLFMSEELEALYFRKSQAEEALESR